MNEPYFIEVENNGCSHCRHGRTYGVIGPDGVMLGQSYADQDEAEWLAEQLNIAYFAGQRKDKE